MTDATGFYIVVVVDNTTGGLYSYYFSYWREEWQ